MRHVYLAYFFIVCLLTGWAAKTIHVEEAITPEMRRLQQRVEGLEKEAQELKKRREFLQGQIKAFDQEWGKRQKAADEKIALVEKREALLDEKAELLLKLRRELEEKRKALVQ